MAGSFALVAMGRGTQRRMVTLMAGSFALAAGNSDGQLNLGFCFFLWQRGGEGCSPGGGMVHQGRRARGSVLRRPTSSARGCSAGRTSLAQCHAQQAAEAKLVALINKRGTFAAPVCGLLRRPRASPPASAARCQAVGGGPSAGCRRVRTVLVITLTCSYVLFSSIK